MAGRLGSRAPRYALVVSSGAARAQETARIIAGRLDRIEAGLLPDFSPIFPDRSAYERLRDLTDFAALLRADDRARLLAEQQLSVWSSLIAGLADDANALAVSHGGILELTATLAAERAGVTLAGRPFGYCEGVRVRFVGSAPAAVEALRSASLNRSSGSSARSSRTAARTARRAPRSSRS